MEDSDVAEMSGGGDGQIPDDELLYRAIALSGPTSSGLYFVDKEARTIRISSQAFADRQRRPSVDIASLRSYDPSKAQFEPSDGIVSLSAGQVRGIRSTLRDKKGKEAGVQAADVEPVPLPDNLAHAEIYGKPAFEAETPFRKIREELARLAKWEIMPSDLRVKETTEI